MTRNADLLKESISKLENLLGSDSPLNKNLMEVVRAKLEGQTLPLSIPVREQHARKQEAEGLSQLSGLFKSLGLGDLSIAKKTEQGATAARAATGDPDAIIMMARNKVQETQGRMEQVKSGFGHALGGMINPREMQGMGQTIGGIGQMAGGLIGGPAGAAVGALTKFGEVLTNSIEGLKGWTNSLHHANMQFAEFSASMAGVQARQELRDMQLSQERGERRAESAEYLAEGKNRLEQSTAPIEDAFANAKNWIGGFIADGVAQLLEPLEGILEFFRLSSKKQKLTDFEEWQQQQLKNSKWSENHERPERFRGEGGAGGAF